MKKVFFIIGIISVVLVVLHILFLIGLHIYEIIKNKIDDTATCYSLEKNSNVWLYSHDNFYLIPTICIYKDSYIEISINWLCFIINIGYRIKKDG